MAKNLFSEILEDVEGFSTEDNSKKIKKKIKKLSKKEKKKLEKKLGKKIQKKIKKKLKKGSKKENTLFLNEIHSLQRQMLHTSQKTDEIILGFFRVLNKQFQHPREIVEYQDIPLLSRKGDNND